jgi:O-acetyl-ADP-ribose deacetylase (regulator of RNase III)
VIQNVEGDILLSGAELIAHGVAPHDHFDTGLARALRERWPSLVRDFRHATHQDPLSPGDIWAWAGVDDDGHKRRIVNLITQTELGERGSARPGPATLQNVEHALKKLAAYAQHEKVKSLALPRLATGVGKLEWSDVKPLVTRHLGELGIPVMVYETYRADTQANEKLG